MIVDAAESVVLSTLAWADRGNLVAIRTSDGTASAVPVSERLNLEIFPGDAEFFAVQHAQANVTVHAFAAPGRALATVAVDGLTAKVAGSAEALARVPRHYAVMTERDFALLSIDGVGAKVERFPWYDEGYDKGYQGIFGISPVPGTGLLAIAVQRDSRIIIYDPERRDLVARVPLAGRQGNPQLRFRRRAAELWATDFDTIVKLRSDGFAAVDSQLLQRPSDTGVRQFIGSFAFDREERIAAVARPFSDDVAGLEPATMRMTQVCSFAQGSRPVDVAVLSDGRVFARGLKGAILSGVLKQRRFYRFFG